MGRGAIAVDKSGRALREVSLLENKEKSAAAILAGFARTGWSGGTG